MKRVQGLSTENTFEVFGFDILTANEMNKVRGGVISRPKSRDKDVFDDEEEV